MGSTKTISCARLPASDRFRVDHEDIYPDTKRKLLRQAYPRLTHPQNVLRANHSQAPDCAKQRELVAGMARL